MTSARKTMSSLLMLVAAGLCLFFSACGVLDPADENEAPVITLKGKQVDSIGIGHSYIDSGATASDAEDGDLTSAIVTSGSVDTSTAGKYTITYSVADSDGKTASALRTVWVVDNTIAIESPECPSVYDCTSVSYKIAENLTIPSGCTVTFGANTVIEVLDDIDVDGELIIREGAKLLVDENVSIDIDNGTLTIEGSETANVVFTNYAPGKYWGRGEDDSYWYSRYGVVISDNANSNTSIKHCTFDSATVGLYVEKDGITISHATFSNNAYAGIFFESCGPKDSASFLNNSFTGVGKTASYFPMYIDATFLSRLSGTAVFNTNANDAVAVEGEEITETGSWKKLDVPYVFRDYATINNSNGVTITIRPGAKFAFLGETYLAVNYGTFIAEGESADSIVFTNFEGGKYWGSGDDNSYWYSRYGIRFTDNANTNSSLKYCVFDSATAGVYSKADGISISHCNFTKCAYAGIYFDNCGPKDSASFLNNSFVENGKTATFFPLYIDATYLYRMSGTSGFSGNAVDAVAVEGEEVSETGVWKKLDVPYVFRDYAVINNTNGVVITIEPGAKFKFLDEMSLSVNNGTLIAEGTATDSIRFSNYVDGKYWGNGDANSYLHSLYGLKFTDNANANSSVKYCAFDSATVAINVDEATVHVSNCTISNTLMHGIYSYGAGNTNIDDASITYVNIGQTPDHMHEQ
ncbi:MAG: DUF5011 domain-containing protein [Chitinivibrionales bacterium]|nr:DUF5011 domain-containing protein [Chitinivibrionales bacterium]